MKIGRIKFAVKEIAIFEDNIMELMKVSILVGRVIKQTFKLSMMNNFLSLKK